MTKTTEELLKRAEEAVEENKYYNNERICISGDRENKQAVLITQLSKKLQESEELNEHTIKRIGNLCRLLM